MSPLSGLIQAGKIRRGRPVLPSAAELRKLNSSSADDEDGLPPGCTIINRNTKANAAAAEFGTAGRVPDTDAPTRRIRKATPLLAAAEPAITAVENAGAGIVATGTEPSSSVVDVPAAANPPAGVYTTLPQRRLTAVGDSSRASAEKPKPATAGSGSSSKPSALKQAWASAEAFLGSVAASVGGTTEQDGILGHRADGSPEQRAVPAPARSKAVPPMGKGSTRISRPRRVKEKIPAMEMPPAVPPLPSPREMAKKVVPSRAVRYNPGPAFRETRGRKKKALLDPSEITKDGVVGTKELIALLKDPALQQVSLIELN